jgi:dTMP kinase
MKGIFITFEGIDGCGKSTMLDMTADWLRQQAKDVIPTREPGGSGLAAHLREVLLSPDFESLDARAETLLFAADRAAHVKNVILPALERGEIVLCDRYTDSTLAYQGGGRGLDKDFLKQLNDFAAYGLRPDITFYFKISAEAAIARRQGEQDKMERENEKFFDRVIAAYDELAEINKERIVMIDAERSIEAVFESVKEVIVSRGMI